MKYLSKIFHPLIVTPNNVVRKTKNITCKSQLLLSELGLVRPTKTSGCFSYLPLAMRSLDKLTRMVEAKMEKIDAQKTMFPILASEELWIKSKRLDNSQELMKMTDRLDRKYILSPTHEELYTDLLATISPVSTNDLPIKLYQIGSKFRDEKRPRYGIIRSREFLMKDLYTFDTSEETSKGMYEQVCEVYDELFKEIGVPFVKVSAPTGMIGGDVSHEYHYTTDSVGEDKILECLSCSYKFSAELLPDVVPASDNSNIPCINCKSQEGFKTSLSLEVGHTFLLGTRYSEPFSAMSTNGKPLHMGCYGLGITRILGACLETLCTEEYLRWPKGLAPYMLCIIGPKKGSKEAAVGEPLMEKICKEITEHCCELKDDIVIDDRNELTIGKRVMNAKKIGYPFILVIGQKAVSETPKFEFFDVCNDKIALLDEGDIVHKLKECTSDFMLPSTLKISDDLLNENSVK